MRIRTSLIVALIGVAIFWPRGVFADDLETIKKSIADLEAKLTEIQNQKQSLASTINYLTTRIQLTQSQINQTTVEITALEEQITGLNGKIGVLNVNLDKLSSIMVSRVNASYKNSLSQPVSLFLTSNGFTDFFRRYKYLKVSQQHDRAVIFALEEARTNYDTQKKLKEQKQAEVEALQAKLVEQKGSLDKQQKAKQAALVVTRNDERRFQDQLARAIAELHAIQSIIAGNGNETEVAKVNEGDKIASVIPDASACSNGAHLHFEVVKDNAHQNPANFLGAKSVTWDNAPDGPFAFTGSWRWPVSDPIRITQGYGMTFYAATLKYYGGSPHTGVDMINMSDLTVSAVKPGTLYRGAIACGGGMLRYVRVQQSEGINTYYLHVNY